MSDPLSHPEVLEGLAIEMMRDKLKNIFDNKSEKLRRYEWRVSVSGSFTPDGQVILADWKMDYIPQPGDVAREDLS